MMLHTGDLSRMNRCPRLAWLNWHHHEVQSPYYNMPESFSSLWVRAYGLENTPEGKTGDTNEDSLRLLEGNRIVRNIRFSWNGLRVRIPWLEKTEDGWKAVWPLMTPRVQEAWSMLVARKVAEKSGILITSQEVVTLDRSYIRNGELDLQKLFMRSARLENRKHRETSPIEELQAEMDLDLEDLIRKGQELMEADCPPAESGRHCAMGRRCAEYDICFDIADRSGNDTLFLRNVPGHFELPEGKISDLDPDFLQSWPTALAQYKASLSDPYVDRKRLRDWLEKTVHPYSYLDFEWDTFAVPPYDNMKPFDVLCFQFSLHTDTETGLEHSSFFGYGDCREAFIQALLEQVPPEGTIFVYNMEGAERLRLKQLAAQFPEYAHRLEQIWDRMVDLSKPFETGMYYDLKMKGRFSLKQVVRLFTDDPVYHDLKIRDGMEAVMAYRAYETADEARRLKIENELSRYCGMDTYAEYLVLHGLIRALEEPDNAQSDHPRTSG